MERVYRRCCGMDVHKKSVVVYVRPVQGQEHSKPLEKQFGTFTRDLRNLRTWLKQCRVTEVVMEATGQYWRAVWNVLEGEVPRLVLVNPQHVKALAGRKTDRIDSRRLARYLENGDLEGSFVPPREIRELRDLTRWRVHLMEDVNRVKNRIGQICEAGNIKVSSVATDLFGTSGRRMLAAIVEGKRDAGWMADYACGRLRQKRTELERALEGSFTDHQRWMLQKELEHLYALERLIDEAEAEIRRRMEPYAEQVQRLVTIPGVDRITAWMFLSELGPEMSVFPDAEHAASWAGMCPGNRNSAGRQKSGRTRKANPYVRRGLCQAAWAASHTRDTYLAALYRRFRGRMGHQEAIFAVAHQMLITAYTMLQRKENYRELGGDYFDQRNRPRVVHRLVDRLTRLGYLVNLKEVAQSPILCASLSSSQLPASEPPISAAPTVSARSSEPSAGHPKRGRPCQCATRAIPCKHRGNSQDSTASSLNT